MKIILFVLFLTISNKEIPENLHIPTNERINENNLGLFVSPIFLGSEGELHTKLVLDFEFDKMIMADKGSIAWGIECENKGYGCKITNEQE